MPLYIAQLLHATGQFDRLKEYAPPLLDESSGLDEESVAEVATCWAMRGTGWRLRHRLALLGTGLGRHGRPWPQPGVCLQMGYTRYRMGEWRGALDCLPLATYGEDELAQNAAYHMADCYLELGDRARAKQAFRTASFPTSIWTFKRTRFSTTPSWPSSCPSTPSTTPLWRLSRI